MKSGVVSGSRNALDTIISQRKLPQTTIGDPERCVVPDI